MNIEHLQQMLSEGYVRRQKHPKADLWIYNYSATAQYERIWNETTIQCRGLILNEQFEIIARPFPKFFNLGETDNQIIPDESFEVYEKMDGSLGILYFLEGKPYIATRGSFNSEQSKVATALLYEKYAHCISKLDASKTYLFEIVYPENRIVVDYGATKDLVLLAIIDTTTGLDIPLEDLGFPIVRRYDGIKDIGALKTLEVANKEGFVIKFKSGLRYKVKFEEYVRIHRIITGVSTVSIWEYLCTGQSFNEILEQVPDEFYQWVKAKKLELNQQFDAIEVQCKQDFKQLETRKETAAYFFTCTYPRVLFAMLDNKPYDTIIWRLVRPVFEKPFISGGTNDSSSVTGLKKSI